MKWDDMSDAEKRAYIAEAVKKKSASAAAREVKTTRSAILGAAYRYKIKFSGAKDPRHKPKTPFNAFVNRGDRPREKAPVERAVPGSGARNAREGAAWKKLDALPAWAPLKGQEPQALERISMCQCRWPVWRDGEPRMVCGAETDEVEGYCAEHRKIAGGRRKAGKDGKLMPGDGGYRTARLKHVGTDERDTAAQCRGGPADGRRAVRAA